MALQKEEIVFLDRSARHTRGKRMTKLLDEEVEMDNQFWNQDALKEVEEDANYEEEQEIADEFDSDFDEDEPDPDDDGENDGEEVVRVKKRLIFPGKSANKKKSKKKVLTALDRTSKDVHSPDRSPSVQPEQQDAPDDGTERVVRKSTRTLVIVRQAEREAIRAALQATMKPIKRKKEGEEKRMTQEEMLLEAAQTEVMNLRNLEHVLAREEEVKKRAVVHKEVYDGPQVRYYSRDGKNYVEFHNGLSFQSEICTNQLPYSEQVLCAVTSRPAMYRDPLTGLPYATKEAFKFIRERFSQVGSNNKEKIGTGTLFGLVSEQGFTVRRKRSKIPSKNYQSKLFR
ncbi:SWR1 complex subunit 2 isoform X2 [Nymphaea colorata]|uniref:SWR1 complex subunit 2 isoform X2 n=1 Tax=Nymphaea colorata TaxID=210225 RepID=UPI00129EB026|nr:SWR1 complex subunit 2 isoform X2 [Nymphaea colorata]